MTAGGTDDGALIGVSSDPESLNGGAAPVLVDTVHVGGDDPDMPASDLSKLDAAAALIREVLPHDLVDAVAVAYWRALDSLGMADDDDMTGTSFD